MLSENETYILRGVIEHIGKSTKEGHYNAYVRTGKEWVEFSDERSSKASWEEVKNKQAYVLIWEKIDGRGKVQGDQESSKVTFTKDNTKIPAEDIQPSKPMQTTQAEEAVKMDIDLKGMKRKREPTDCSLMLNEKRSENNRVEKRPKANNDQKQGNPSKEKSEQSHLKERRRELERGGENKPAKPEDTKVEEKRIESKEPQGSNEISLYEVVRSLQRDVSSLMKSKDS